MDALASNRISPPFSRARSTWTDCGEIASTPLASTRFAWSPAVVASGSTLRSWRPTRSTSRRASPGVGVS